MKCYYHNTLDAVGTCKKCGKFLCKNCIDLNPGTGLCPDCINIKIQDDNLKKQKAVEDALIDTTAEFIKSIVIGILIGGIACFLMNISGAWYDYPLSSKIVFFLVFFTVPYGWALITYLQSKIPLTVFGSLAFWWFWFAFKLAFSICLGIPSFIYQVIKFIVTRKNLKS